VILSYFQSGGNTCATKNIKMSNNINLEEVYMVGKRDHYNSGESSGNESHRDFVPTRLPKMGQHYNSFLYASIALNSI
jgi:hypothetical protein